MRLTLSAHKQDSDMIQAFTKIGRKSCLAFVVHIDCITDQQIRTALEDGAEIAVEMNICKHGEKNERISSS